jgi:hypothetical protein
MSHSHSVSHLMYLLYLCLDPRPRVGGRPPKRACHLLRPAIAARGAQGPCPPRPPVFQPPAGPQRFGERPPLSALGTPRAVQLRRSSPGAAAAAPRHCLSPTALVRVQARDSCPAGGRATRASISAWMVGRCQPVWDVTAGLEGVTRRSAGRSATAGCQTVTLSGCHRHPGDPVGTAQQLSASECYPTTFPPSFSLSCLHAETRGALLPLQLRRSSRRCPLLRALPLTRCSCARAGARQLRGRWQGYSGANVGMDGWSLPACVGRYGRP